MIGTGWEKNVRKSSIARFVRQTRNVTYEKSDPAKIFFARFSEGNRRFGKIPRARVRQTRTRPGASEDVLFGK